MEGKEGGWWGEEDRDIGVLGERPKGGLRGEEGSRGAKREPQPWGSQDFLRFPGNLDASLFLTTT